MMRRLNDFQLLLRVTSGPTIGPTLEDAAKLAHLLNRNQEDSKRTGRAKKLPNKPRRGK
jgi:hypothetical protein